MSSRSPGSPGHDVGAVPVDEAWAHRGDLMHYARRLLGANAELAEDVVQEAFLRLHERVASGVPVREARPWLFRVTRNLALDERRRTRRGDAVRTSLEVVSTRPPGPHEVVQGREDARQALRGLGSLPPRERRTLLLEQAGLPPTAIARRMQTTTNAVHQSLFRARRRLRDARAAAWGLLPLPLIRLFLRAAGSPALDRLPALAPGSGGRFAGAASVAGLVAAAVIGGGVVADQPVVPHPAHSRASVAVPDAAPPHLEASAVPGGGHVDQVAVSRTPARSSDPVGAAPPPAVRARGRTSAPESEPESEPEAGGDSGSSPPETESAPGVREVEHEDSVSARRDDHPPGDADPEEAAQAAATEPPSGTASESPEDPQDPEPGSSAPSSAPE